MGREEESCAHPCCSEWPATCLTLFHSGSTSALLDLSGLDLPPSGTTYPATPTHPGSQSSAEQPSASVSLLDDELMSLGKDEDSAGHSAGDSAGQPAGTSILCSTGRPAQAMAEQRGLPIVAEAVPQETKNKISLADRRAGQLWLLGRTG